MFADFDNDGLVDLVMTYEQSTNRLYRNLGGGHIQELSSSVVATDGVANCPDTLIQHGAVRNIERSAAMLHSDEASHGLDESLTLKKVCG